MTWSARAHPIKPMNKSTEQGFSSFTMPLPARFHDLPAAQGVESVQVTLVDCPGHASLIRTIIGGAHIIDAVLLVVDVTEGVQAQTVECVVIAEVATKCVVIALNKVCLLVFRPTTTHARCGNNACMRAVAIRIA